MRLLKIMALALVLVLTSGCATSRSVISLKPKTDANATATPSAPSQGQVVVLRSIKDERVFEEAPKTPDIPSLGFEGAAQATAQIKARAVARKRNTYGKALGDVLLEEGETVEGVIRDNLTQALVQAGYDVKTEAGPESKALLIDVHVKEFWSWFQPGFWALKLHGNIKTELAFSDQRPTAKIEAQAEESHQMALESDWVSVIQLTLKEYRKKVAEQFSKNTAQH